MRAAVPRLQLLVALGVVVALLVGAEGPVAFAQAVTAEDLASAEAELADAGELLEEARSRLAEAEAARSDLSATLDALRVRGADADASAAAEAIALRDRLTRMYMVAGRAEELRTVIGEIGPFFTRLAYLSAIADRDREVVNRFTVLIDELASLRDRAEARLADMTSKVAALELVQATRAAAFDEATVRAEQVRQRFAQQEAERQAALAAEVARQEAALASQGSAAGGTASVNPTTTTTVPVVTGHTYDPGGGVEQWRPLLTSIFARWGLTQEKCGSKGCVGPQVDNALTIMWCESRGVPFAVNPSSHTTGLFQHRPIYWPDRTARVRNNPNSGGVFPADATPYDPAANIEVAALLIWESRETLIGNLNWGGPWDDGPEPFGHWDSTSRYCAKPPLVYP